MSGVSIPVLASSVFFTAFSAFGAGYLMSPQPVRDSRPIVDPEAWNRTVLVAPSFDARTTSAQADAAMHAAANDVNHVGEVKPKTVAEAQYQDEIPHVDAADTYESASYNVEPLDGAATDDDKGSATIIVLDKAEADRAWDTSPASLENIQ
jgi:hypothetical protein